MGWETGPFHMYIEKYKAHIVWPQNQFIDVHTNVIESPIKMREMLISEVVISYDTIVDDSLILHIHKNRHINNNSDFWYWFKAEYPSAIISFDKIVISDAFECIKFKFIFGNQ